VKVNHETRPTTATKITKMINLFLLLCFEGVSGPVWLVTLWSMKLLRSLAEASTKVLVGLTSVEFSNF
jgi:hypothetical protein